MTRKTKKYLSLANNIWWPLLLCLIAMLFTLRPRLFSLAYGLIDPSFNYGVNQAAANHLSFGTDFISTYGPLGFLVSNFLPSNIYKVSAWMLVYAFLLGYGSYLFVKYYYPQNKKHWLIVLAIIYTLSMTNGGNMIEWNYFSVFLIWCFIYLKLSNRRRLLLGIAMSLAASIFLFSKFTLGFGTLATLLLLICFAPVMSKREKIQQLGIVSFTSIAFIVLLGIVTHTHSLFLYMKSALIMSAGFSSAMSLYEPHTQIATFLVFISIIIIFAWPIFLVRRQALKYVFIIPILALIWRYAVVRQDMHLEAILPVVFPLVLMLFLSLSLKYSRARNAFVGLIVVVLASASVWANNLPFSGPNGYSSFVSSPIKNVIDGSFINFFKINKQRATWTTESALRTSGAALPQTMRQKIGKSSVDIFPWEAVIVASNDLKWKPRPSPFSFESYDPYFDNQNSSFFSSNDSSKYIIWHNTSDRSIDARSIFWDEPKTFRTFLTNYDVIESSQGFMLLKRKLEPDKLEIIQKQNTVAKWDIWLKMPQTKSDTLTFASFEISKSLNTDAQELIVRGGQYYIEIKWKDGSTRNYRFIPSNTKQGILLTALPSSWDSIVSLLENKQINKDQVEAFRFSQASGINPSSQPFNISLTSIRLLKK